VAILPMASLARTTSAPVCARLREIALSAHFARHRAKFDLNQLRRPRRDHNFRSTKEGFMPIESVVVITAIVAVFIGFALVLAWGESQTRNLHDH
jgi:hypothetical protein